MPVLNMIYRWVFEGTLDDPFAEFFVASNPDVHVDRLWHDKYSLREDMRPAFVSKELAAKVLSIVDNVYLCRLVHVVALTILAVVMHSDLGCRQIHQFYSPLHARL